MSDEKEIRWVGSAYEDLLAFPDEPRRSAGFQLGKVQVGLEPADWKPFDEVGAGTREIRIRETSGIYRVMYVAKFEEAVYVLHCFQKKTPATSKQDKVIAEVRYRAVVTARKGQK
jgi:phage-related protein